jgi:hypothetical protein
MQETAGDSPYVWTDVPPSSKRYWALFAYTIIPPPITIIAIGTFIIPICGGRAGGRGVAFIIPICGGRGAQHPADLAACCAMGHSSSAIAPPEPSVCREAHENVLPAVTGEFLHTIKEHANEEQKDHCGNETAVNQLFILLLSPGGNSVGADRTNAKFRK